MATNPRDPNRTDPARTEPVADPYLRNGAGVDPIAPTGVPTTGTGRGNQTWIWAAVAVVVILLLIWWHSA